jgi:hypothetical protein
LLFLRFVEDKIIWEKFYKAWQGAKISAGMWLIFNGDRKIFVP